MLPLQMTTMQLGRVALVEAFRRVRCKDDALNSALGGATAAYALVGIHRESTIIKHPPTTACIRHSSGAMCHQVQLQQAGLVDVLQPGSPGYR